MMVNMELKNIDGEVVNIERMMVRMRDTMRIGHRRSFASHVTILNLKACGK